MKMNTTQNQAKPLTAVNRMARAIYALVVLLFLSGLAYQVFLAGAGALVNPAYWEQHRSFAHVIELMPLLMLVIGLFARLPLRMHLASVLLFALFLMQYAFLYLTPVIGLPTLRGLHAVNALALFLISWQMGARAWPLLRSPQATA